MKVHFDEQPGLHGQRIGVATLAAPQSLKRHRREHPGNIRQALAVAGQILVHYPPFGGVPRPVGRGVRSSRPCQIAGDDLDIPADDPTQTIRLFGGHLVA